MMREFYALIVRLNKIIKKSIIKENIYERLASYAVLLSSPAHKSKNMALLDRLIFKEYLKRRKDIGRTWQCDLDEAEQVYKMRIAKLEEEFNSGKITKEDLPKKLQIELDNQPYQDDR